jgi:hypothetical protein
MGIISLTVPIIFPSKESTMSVITDESDRQQREIYALTDEKTKLLALMRETYDALSECLYWGNVDEDDREAANKVLAKLREVL